MKTTSHHLSLLLIALLALTHTSMVAAQTCAQVQIGIKGNTLNSGSSLYQGQSLKAANNPYYAILQPDGNFVLYAADNVISANAFFYSKTSGQGIAPYRLAMQIDGNLVLYDGNNKALWNTGTKNQGKAPYQLVLQDDGNLVLYDSAKTALWNSNSAVGTAGGLAAFAKNIQKPTLQAPTANEGPCDISTLGNTLHSPGSLQQGQALKASSHQYYAVMQVDGNFVIYGTNNQQPSTAFWTSNTAGQGVAPYHLIVQSDGNLAVIDSTNNALWQAGTEGNGQPPFQLVMGDDGNLVLYDSNNKALWDGNSASSNAGGLAAFAVNHQS